MTIRKRTATISPDTYGSDSEDLTARSSNDRWYGLFGVRVRHDDPKPFHVTVREVDLDDDNEETDGEILFHVMSPRDGVIYSPRVESVTESVDHAATAGNATAGTGEENAMKQIGTRQVRVDVDRATASGTIYVDVYMQTPGDYRF